MFVYIAETLENGHSVNEFISHGIDLLTALLPQTSPVEEIRYVYTCMCVHVCICVHVAILQCMLGNNIKFGGAKSCPIPERLSKLVEQLPIVFPPMAAQLFTTAQSSLFSLHIQPGFRFPVD